MVEDEDQHAREAPGREALAGRSFAGYAADVLRDQLIVLEIPPGAPINDEYVGRELGIGRTPVREALKRLESEHLVTSFPRRGTFAAPVDMTELADITEIRARLEPLAAARAARRCSPDQRSEMLALVERLAALDLADTPASELMTHDLDVHRRIYAAGGNRHLEEDLRKYGNLATRIWCVVIDRLGDVGEHVGEHVGLLRAVADGDAERSAALAEKHVIGFEALVRSAL